MQWAITYQNQQMQLSVCKYITHTVYLLHVLVTHVAIFREMHYKGLRDWNITEIFESMHQYKILLIY
jgi:hypothetical protein